MDQYLTMDDRNNNQNLGLDGWPDNVFGFLRGTKSSGMNLWITYSEDNEEPLVLDNETHNLFSDVRVEERDDEEEGLNEEEEEDYNPYFRHYYDSEDWGHGFNMPKAWVQ